MSLAKTLCIVYCLLANCLLCNRLDWKRQLLDCWALCHGICPVKIHANIQTLAMLLALNADAVSRMCWLD